MNQDTSTTTPIDSNDTPAISTRARPLRRRYSRDFKRQLVEQTLSGQESVSVIARRHDVNANQLFRWRRDYQNGLLADTQTLLPVRVISMSSASPVEESNAIGQLAITLANGHQLIVTGSVCSATLQTALNALTRC